MAAGANCMIFVPTALDTYIQAQCLNPGTAPANTAPNVGLYQIVVENGLTRTGITINSVPGFAYQGDLGLVYLLVDYLRQRLVAI
jgi:hypothetical protein